MPLPPALLARLAKRGIVNSPKGKSDKFIQFPIHNIYVFNV